MHVSPTRRGAGVGVAEPDMVIKRFALVRALSPQFCGHYGGIAPNPDRLLLLLLVLIHDLPASRHSRSDLL